MGAIRHLQPAYRYRVGRSDREVLRILNQMNGSAPRVDVIEASDGRLMPARNATGDELTVHRRRVLELRERGLSFPQIGAEVGISESAAHRDLGAGR